MPLTAFGMAVTQLGSCENHKLNVGLLGLVTSGLRRPPQP